MLLFYLFATIVGITTMAQVVVPHMRGKPIFPAFRRKSLKQLMAAKSDLKDAENELAEAQLRKQAAETRVSAAKIGAETAVLEMDAYEIREDLLDSKTESDRQLAAGANGADPAAIVSLPPPNGETAH